jgi:hypothetical protein
MRGRSHVPYCWTDGPNTTLDNVCGALVFIVFVFACAHRTVRDGVETISQTLWRLNEGTRPRPVRNSASLDNHLNSIDKMHSKLRVVAYSASRKNVAEIRRNPTFIGARLFLTGEPNCN